MATGFHVSPIYRRHVTSETHVERVGRIDTMIALADKLGETVVSLEGGRPADRDTLLLAHADAYVEIVAGTAGQHFRFDWDTEACPDSYEVACHAAGATVATVDAVLDGDVDNAFAAVRPPGHHAESHRAMGFCLFGNVAIAARHLVRRRGLERVMVIDWDVHHGNGTQEILYDDPGVLFVSLHQHPLYPGTGMVEETGTGDGDGYTINIPLPAGCGDADYDAAFARIIEPAADWFRPDFIIVSAGFDAHRSDPLANMLVTENGFAHMASRTLAMARAHCGGRLAAVLEGGYDLRALSDGVETVVGVLAGGMAPETPIPGEVVAAGHIDAVLDTHARFGWVPEKG